MKDWTLLVIAVMSALALASVAPIVIALLLVKWSTEPERAIVTPVSGPAVIVPTVATWTGVVSVPPCSRLRATKILSPTR